MLWFKKFRTFAIFANNFNKRWSTPSVTIWTLHTAGTFCRCFCSEFANFLGELLQLPSQPIIRHDFNYPGRGDSVGIDHHRLSSVPIQQAKSY